MKIPKDIDGMVFWQQRLSDIFATRDFEAGAANLANSLLIRVRNLHEVVNQPSFEGQIAIYTIHLGELFSFISAVATHYRIELSVLIDEYLTGRYTDLLPLLGQDSLTSTPSVDSPVFIPRPKLPDSKPMTLAGYQITIRTACNGKGEINVQNHLASICEKALVLAENVDSMSAYSVVGGLMSEGKDLYDEFIDFKKNLVQTLVHWFSIVSALRLGADHVLEHVFEKGCLPCGNSLCSCRLNLEVKEDAFRANLGFLPNEGKEDELGLWLAGMNV